jgi:hypothetical protein
MSIPGFTGESSLFEVATRYRASSKIAVYNQFVQPAGLFDTDRPTFCLKTVCELKMLPLQNPKMFCRRELGVWDPVAATCV